MNQNETGLGASLSLANVPIALPKIREQQLHLPPGSKTPSHD
jgi:hypothetical protein